MDEHYQDLLDGLGMRAQKHYKAYVKAKFDAARTGSKAIRMMADHYWKSYIEALGEIDDVEKLARS